MATYNCIRPVIDNSLMTAKVASWASTPGLDSHRILSARIVRDYRCVTEALFSGYMVQAATVASGLYEAALTVRYIGHDQQRQKEWFAHEDPTRLPWPLGSMVRAIHPDHLDLQGWYKDCYRHLCMLKHGNPLRWDAAFDDPTICFDELN